MSSSSCTWYCATVLIRCSVVSNCCLKSDSPIANYFTGRLRAFSVCICKSLTTPWYLVFQLLGMSGYIFWCSIVVETDSGSPNTDIPGFCLRTQHFPPQKISPRRGLYPLSVSQANTLTSVLPAISVLESVCARLQM